ncbi:MAG: PilZ domain-containing protein [Xanthobacteraceae bacterium]
MLERRTEMRTRTFLGGVIAFDRRYSTVACQVRNLTQAGAYIRIESTAAIPAEFDFSIPARGRSFRAQLVWRDEEAAGLRFTSPAESTVTPLDYAIKLRTCERENVDLKRRIADLSAG